MSSSLRIAEVTERVGIFTATVSSCERTGVLPEPERGAERKAGRCSSPSFITP